MGAHGLLPGCSQKISWKNKSVVSSLGQRKVCTGISICLGGKIKKFANSNSIYLLLVIMKARYLKDYFLWRMIEMRAPTSLSCSSLIFGSIKTTGTPGKDVSVISRLIWP